MAHRLDIERQQRLEPKRMEFAIEQLEKIKGVRIDLVDEVKIIFYWKENKITLFPYSGWHTGKSIKDGRGIENLLKQLVN